ncbi:MAG: dihydroorotase [Nitrososphaerales archaeon]
MAADMVIKNSHLVVPKLGIVNAGVAITDGKIVSIASEVNLPQADQVIDARGNYVFPGAIDPHAHYGHTYGRYNLDFGENLQSETISAALGGVTTVNVIHRLYPPTASYFEFFSKQVKPVIDKASINFLITPGVMTQLHVDEMPRYARELGMTSFKFFRGYKGGEWQQMGISGLDDGIFYAMLFQAAKLGGNALSLVHCENSEVANYTSERTKKEGKTGLAAWNDARPKEAESDSILSAINLACVVAQTRLYIPHVSTDWGIDAIAKAKFDGRNVIAETCPQYLCFTKDDEKKIGILGKVNPPIRDRASRDRLWDRILDGTVDTIGTDHVPVRLNDKLGDGDIWSAGLAFPGSATMIPTLLSEGFNRRGLSLQRIAEMTSYNTARAFGLFPQKGTLAPGADADMTIVDPSKEVTASSELLGSAAGFTLFEGWRFKGWPTHTIVGGHLIMEDGKFFGKPGFGRYLRRNL